MKFPSSLEGDTSTIEARRAIRNAAHDDAVKSILIVFDTPGGTAAGTSDLAEDVKNAAAMKPVHSYLQDLAASAGYYVASSVTRINGNPRLIPICVKINFTWSKNSALGTFGEKP